MQNALAGQAAHPVPLEHVRSPAAPYSSIFRPGSCHACGLTLQSRGQTTAGRNCSLRPTHSRRCLPLISNVGHHGRSPCFRASTAFSQHRMKFPRSSLLLRVSPPNTWRAFQGTVVRPLWRSLVATLRLLGATSWVLSTLRFVAPVVAVARLPISLLLALRAAVLRLAVSPWAPPSTAAHFSAFAPAVP
jgi:hypothetical protein